MSRNAFQISKHLNLSFLREFWNKSLEPAYSDISWQSTCSKQNDVKFEKKQKVMITDNFVSRNYDIIPLDETSCIQITEIKYKHLHFSRGIEQIL